MCRWVWFGRAATEWTTCFVNRWTWTSSEADWAGRVTAPHYLGFIVYNLYTCAVCTVFGVFNKFGR